MAIRKTTDDDRRSEARRQCQRELDRKRRSRQMTADACDMLQAELDIGATPSIYWDAHEHRWYIWSDCEHQRYTLAGWEQMTTRYVRGTER